MVLIIKSELKFGKKLNLTEFDMWGAAHSPNPDKNDPYYGFHRFKEGYGAKLVENIGTYDLIFNENLYWLFTFVDKWTSLKVFLLNLIGKA